jgi:PAS domain S-box-containing protein
LVAANAEVASHADGLRAEVERLRQREAYYRRLIEDAHASTERFRAMTLALGEMSASTTLFRLGLDAQMRELANGSAKQLGVARVGIWLMDELDSRIECVCLIRSEGVPGAKPDALTTTMAPAYFSALREARVVAAHDARSDPRTAELTSSYLNPLGITSMLDAPVRAFGEVVGVVCHEHIGPVRTWTPEEQSFAAAVGDLVALAILSARRVDAEALAARGAARYRYLVESLPVTVYSLHPEAAMLDYVSPQIARLTGEGPEVFAGASGLSSWLERVHPGDATAVSARITRPRVYGDEAEMTYRVRHADGTWRWVHDAYRVVRNASGEPMGVQGVLEDVTETVKARVERDEAKRAFDDLIRTCDMFAVILDASGHATFVNDYLLRQLRVKREDVVGHDWFELMLPADQRDSVRERFLCGMRSGAVEPSVESEILDLQGGKRVVRWSNTILLDQDELVAGQASLGVDLTERLEVEGRWREQQKFESLGRMAAGVAHDFNNLLTALLSSVDVLDMELPEHPAVRETMAVIKESARRAHEITSSLLGFARRRPVVPQPFELDHLVQRTLGSIKALVGARITVSSFLRIPGVQVFADESGIQQVLLNLVANARDAMPDGGVLTITADLLFLDAERARRLGGLMAGTFVVLSVRDTGAGMSKVVAEHAFEPFFTTKGDGRGTGLGLSTSHGIINQAGGHIELESAPATGTTFTIYLPVWSAPGSGGGAPAGGDGVLGI